MAKIKDKTTRGLSALMGQIKKDQNAFKVAVQEHVNFLEIDIKNIIPNPQNPRSTFDEKSLLELVDSIKTHGLIQPITVIQKNAKNYQIVAGERRWRASQKAKLQRIPAYIRKANDQEKLEWAIVENLQRERLNPIEIAIGFQRMIEELDYTQEQVAKRVGKERSTIANMIRLLKLPPEIQFDLKGETISTGHARAIISLKDIDLQLDLLQRIKKNDLSVRKTEALAKRYVAPSHSTKFSSQHKNIHIAKLEKNISSHLEKKVSIQDNGKAGGYLKIHYKNTKELNRLVDLLRNK